MTSQSTTERLWNELPSAGERRGAVWLSLAEAHHHRGESGDAIRALRGVALEDDSFRRWLAAARLRRQVVGQLPDRRPYRLGVVGTATLDQLAPTLELAGLIVGLDLDVYVGGYGQYEIELLDPSSGLHRFEPDAILLAPDVSACKVPSLPDDPDQVLSDEVGRWSSVWASIAELSPARLLQYNFVPPLERPLGHHDGQHPGGRRQLVRRLNTELAERARGRVQLIDVASLAEDVGLTNWFDDRYWFHAKQPVALGCLPALSRSSVGALGAGLGRTRKVVVTDLDDTLWGGTVGEDGVENLELDGTARGEAHLALQSYLLQLKERGAVLAVCSKNHDEVARRPFLERDDMLLRLEDFATFVANWEPKGANLRTIAGRLDLPLDAFVFLDDNPAERDAVRLACPEVDVLELPIEPSSYRGTLAAYPALEPLQVTDEDAKRTEQYRARASAMELREEAGSVEDFLAGLAMVATVRPFDAATLQRVAQLVAKTNQFNLTTRRHTTEVLRRFADDPMVVTVSLQLQDRFGDHGTVGVAIAPISDQLASIDTLLMSCRVIGRDVEASLISSVAELARKHGAVSLRGQYLASGRNDLVADLYDRLGFAQDDDGQWSLGVEAALTLDPEHIERQWGE